MLSTLRLCVYLRPSTHWIQVYSLGQILANCGVIDEKLILIIIITTGAEEEEYLGITSSNTALQQLIKSTGSWQNASLLW
jgi:hypothetical protein